MTLGKKIRHARKGLNLSQERLAEKLCVSRSAIAKWEADKGMPDVENLKMLARLLGVSVDSLLDDRSDTHIAVTRHPYSLSSYGRGCKRVRKDRMMVQRFPGAKICALLGRPELTGTTGVVDSARGFLTPDPFGSPEFLKSIRDLDRDFYLIEQADALLFVTVTDQFLEIRPLTLPTPGKEFHLGGWHFIRCEYLAEEAWKQE